jgi:outer membrane lipoprotein-sorting protein
MLKKSAVLAIVLCAFSSGLAHAATDPLPRVETYLNALTTLVADFTQVSPDGTITTGRFYLQRPGKMRWEYDPPTPILIVGNGSVLTYFDKELAQTTHIPMDSTPAGLLARDPIRFDDSVVIESVEDNAGALRVTLHRAEEPGDGKLTLEFSDTPFQLRNLIITDATGQMTTIALRNAHFGETLSPKLFSLHEINRLKK